MKNIHEIEVKIDGEKWQNLIDASFKKRQQEVEVDGFRKGTVPKDVYIKKYGIESLYMDAVEPAMSDAYVQALSENKLIPEAEPEADIVTVNEKEVVFKFNIITKPEVKLGKYKNLGIKADKVTVTDEEIQDEINNLRTRMAEIVVKETGKVENKDTAVIDFEGVVDGEVIEGGSGQDFPLEIGSNTFIPGFEEKVIGMEVGETKDIELKFPENYKADLANKDVTFKVTLKQIKERVLPELGEDFYKDLGHEDVKTEEEFIKIIKDELTKQKEHEAENILIEKLLEAGSNNMEVDINTKIIDDEIHRMVHQYEDQLKMQGLSLEQYFEFSNTTIEDLENMMKDEAEKRVRYRYFLEKIAEAEKIEIADKDADEEAEKLAENYGMKKDEFVQAFGGIDMIKYDLKMRKAMEVLKENN